MNLINMVIILLIYESDENHWDYFIIIIIIFDHVIKFYVGTHNSN